jgi:hypothetical protein
MFEKRLEHDIIGDITDKEDSRPISNIPVRTRKAMANEHAQPWNVLEQSRTCQTARAQLHTNRQGENLSTGKTSPQQNMQRTQP